MLLCPAPPKILLSPQKSGWLCDCDSNKLLSLLLRYTFTAFWHFCVQPFMCLFLFVLCAASELKINNNCIKIAG